MAKTKEKTLKSQGSTELMEATKKLNSYYKENGLDPEKDYSKDKKHGKAVSKLQKKIKTAKMKIDAGIADEHAEKAKRKPDVKPEKVKTIKKQPSSYDYPDIDGKPMTPDLKKRYRSKMRALLKAQMDPNEASKKALSAVMGTASNKLTKPVKAAKVDSSATETKEAHPKTQKSKKKDLGKIKKSSDKAPLKKTKKVVKEED